MTRAEVAAARVRMALNQVEAAQRLLNLAAESLCPLRGLAPQWRKVGNLHDKVKDFWYELDEKRGSGKFDLDRPAEEILRVEPTGVCLSDDPSATIKHPAPPREAGDLPEVDA